MTTCGEREADDRRESLDTAALGACAVEGRPYQPHHDADKLGSTFEDPRVPDILAALHGVGRPVSV